MDDTRFRVCLDRTVELGARLRLRDWPGLSGPLVHVPDPLTPADDLVLSLADEFPPAFRVLSLQPRGDGVYQLDAADLLAFLDQFGFRRPILIGERLGCVAALLLAAWYPSRVARLVLVAPTYDPPASDALRARALRDCPPDWATLRRAVTCPVLELPNAAAEAMRELRSFLAR